MLVCLLVVSNRFFEQNVLRVNRLHGSFKLVVGDLRVLQLIFKTPLVECGYFDFHLMLLLLVEEDRLEILQLNIDDVLMIAVSIGGLHLSKLLQF